MRKILLAALLLVSIGAMSQADGRWITKPGLYSFPKVRITKLDSANNAPGGFLAVGDSGKIYKTALPCNWPAEVPFGEIYNKRGFDNSYDFTKFGAITLTKNGSYYDITSPNTGFNDYIAVTPGQTLTSNFTMVVEGKITAWSGTSFTNYIGLRSSNPNNQFDIQGVFGSTNSGTANAYVYNSQGTALATSAGTITQSLNDVLRYTIARTDTTIRVSVYNLTVGGSDSTFVTYNYFPAGYQKPNSANYAIGKVGDGTFQIMSIKITSDEIKNPNLAVTIDSKSVPYYPTYWATGFPKLLQATYGTVLSYSGASDRIDEWLKSIEYIKRSNPRQAVLFYPSNNQRFGSSIGYTTNLFDSVYTLLTNRGISTTVAIMPEDSTGGGSGGGIGLTAARNYLVAKYPTKYIAVWDSLKNSGNNVLKSAYNYGDGVHLNNAAQSVVASAIVASNLITVCNYRNGVQKDYLSNNYIVDSLGKNSGAGGGGVTLTPSTTNFYPYISGTNALTGTSFLRDSSIYTVSWKNLKVEGAVVNTGNLVAASSIGSLAFFGNPSDGSFIAETRGTVRASGANSAFTLARRSDNTNTMGIYSASGEVNFLNNIGSGNWLTFNQSGNTSTFGGKSLFSASTTSAASINIPAGVAPTSPNAGDVYFDGTHLYYRIGAAWYQLDQQGGGGMTNPLTTTGDIIYSSSGTTPARLGIGSTNQVLTVIGGLPSWQTAASGPSTRIYGGSQITGTNANVTAAAGTVLYLPAATLSANRTIDMTALNTDLDFIRINNAEAGFTWSFTGQSVYLYDRTTVLTNLSPNTNYEIIRVSGKLVIQN